jgi:hypothetical protein
MNGVTPIDGSGKGYVRLYRKLLDHPLFTSKPDLALHPFARKLAGLGVPPWAGGTDHGSDGIFHHFARRIGNTRRTLERTRPALLGLLGANTRSDTQKNTPLDDDNCHELGGLPAIGRCSTPRRHHAPRHTDMEEATHGTPHRTPRAARDLLLKLR